MQISINIVPESPEELARVFAFLSGREGVVLEPLPAGEVAAASKAENDAAEAEDKKAPAKKRKSRKKPAADDGPDFKAIRKQLETDLRAFGAEHGLPKLRDALKAAKLPRMQDAADEDLAKFQNVLNNLLEQAGGDDDII
tara:strand:+ start:7583 stop:8002 length:420 start_codon:yes stop_codon:yes gene_type:complete